MQNCYKILGVKDFASTDEIKIAYRKLSKKFHPDVNNGDKFFEERFKELQNAYEILTDSTQKELHDERLRNSYSEFGRFRSEFDNAGNDEEKKPWESTVNQHAYGEPYGARFDGNKSSTFNPMGKLFRIALNIFGIYIAFIIIKYVALFLLVLVAGVSSGKKQVDPARTDISYSQNSAQKKSRRTHKSTDQFSRPSTDGSNPAENSDKITDRPNSEKDDYFSPGSTTSEVLRVQGAPTSIDKMEPMGMELWYYNGSSITFKNGRVNEFSNIGGNLRIRMTVSGQRDNALDYFTTGSTRADVLAVQGDPTSIDKMEPMGMELWYYNGSSVTFKNGRVSEYSNIGGNLHIRM